MESAQDCHLCQIHGPRPVVEPWLDEKDEPSDSSQQTISTSWNFSEGEEDREDPVVVAEVEDDDHWSSEETVDIGARVT